jgi:hypothetical protein
MTQNRKENTHNPHLPNIEKKKLASPFQKIKNPGPLGCMLHLLSG